MTESREVGPETAGLLAIEQFVAKHPGVDRAAAVLHTDADDEEQLALYITLNETAAEKPTVGQLQTYLEANLSEFAVPDAIIFLEKFPQSPTSFVDNALLPEPRTNAFDPTCSARSEMVFELVARVFGLSAVASTDGFLDLGGTSLLVSRLVSLLRSELNIEVNFRDVVDADSIGSFAESLERRDSATEGAPEDAIRRLAVSPRNRAWPVVEPTYRPRRQSTALRLKGPIDIGVLREAVADVVRRHDALRTLRQENEGALRQVVVDGLEARARLTVIPVAASELAGNLQAEATRYFDRRSELPLHTVLFKLSPENHVLLLTTDRTSCDDRSHQILWRELGQAHAARSAGYAPAWEWLPLQYTDYLCWQAQLLSADHSEHTEEERQLRYWKKALKDLPEELSLPYAGQRPPGPGHRVRTIALDLTEDLHFGLRAVARKRQATLRMVLQAGLAALLTRIGAGYDLPLGTTSSGRSHSLWNGVVGALSNELVLRVDTSGDPSFAELVGRVREVALAADDHRDLPFAQLAAQIQPKRSSSRHPLFQVSIDLVNNSDVHPGFPGLMVTELQLNTGFDLDLDVTFREHFDGLGQPSKLSGTIRYSADLFSVETAKCIAAGLNQLLQAAAAEPEHLISELEIADSTSDSARRSEALASEEGRL